ncbi:cyclic GMP-AMP synthase isoform X2 [Erpetoichthys calabaricus]|uniref:cyclic GMP-AMP synthase isoform X2 n=1 Tax=Erpetoichthys calabaricus TaxID=27687 RepID=UPI002234E8CE|nr:cyclic GMP-AMP synthase isoform X2 [Erpetoichthys calabaricus]
MASKNAIGNREEDFSKNKVKNVAATNKAAKKNAAGGRAKSPAAGGKRAKSPAAAGTRAKSPAAGGTRPKSAVAGGRKVGAASKASSRAKSPGEAGRRATSPPPPAPIPANEAAPRVSGTSQDRATNSDSTRRGSCRGRPSTRQGSAEFPNVEEEACPERAPPPSPDIQVPAEDLNRILLKVLDSIKIRQTDKSEASKQVNDLMKEILSQLKELGVSQQNTGSYYEFVKISEANEFDFMLTMPVDRVKLETFGEEVAFYHVSLKRNAKKELENFVVDETTLSANLMLTEFRKEIKKILRKSKVDAHLQRKKPGCPAITLSLKNAKENGKDIEVDIVPGLEVHSSWPPATNEGFKKIDTWLGTKVKRTLKQEPFYLVPKYVGDGTTKRNGVLAKDVWRISSSNIEKKILKEHGQTRTCCEAHGVKCYRKQCLKLLKYLLQKLKEKHPRELSKFSSYFMKTTLLHVCAKQPEDAQWSLNNLSQRFLQLVTDLIEYLRSGNLPHFFIPECNLLETITTQANRAFLITKLEYELNNWFPIFKPL